MEPRFDGDPNIRRVESMDFSADHRLFIPFIKVIRAGIQLTLRNVFNVLWICDRLHLVF